SAAPGVPPAPRTGPEQRAPPRSRVYRRGGQPLSAGAGPGAGSLVSASALTRRGTNLLYLAGPLLSVPDYVRREFRVAVDERLDRTIHGKIEREQVPLPEAQQIVDSHGRAVHPGLHRQARLP